MNNNFNPDISFTGEIASIIANSPYLNIAMDIPKSKPILGTYDTMKCKVCGKSYYKTLYKDGDGYICKECKKDRVDQ
jgi:hypothetical protein